MKGDATVHTTNAAYRAGWERVFTRPGSHQGHRVVKESWPCGCDSNWCVDCLEGLDWLCSDRGACQRGRKP